MGERSTKETVKALIDLTTAHFFPVWICGATTGEPCFLPYAKINVYS